MESLTENWEKMTELFANDVPFSYTPKTGIVVTDEESEEGEE